MSKELGERFIYWAYCILTLGLVWVAKIVIKRAIIETR